jgi:hypothetical protein
MTSLKLAAVWVPLLLAAAPKTDEAKATQAAKDAVTAWLKLADTNQLEKTWDEAGAMFKAAITRADWAKQLGGVRGALGKLEKRTLSSATYTRSLPGAPEGEYVVTQWEAKFENKAGIETITASHEKDGTWRVVGYFIK